MISCLRPLSGFLRASLLVLLVMGIVIKPVLSSAFELHAADHALSAQDEAPGHDHSDGNEAGVDDSQGMHGLLHGGECGGAYSDAVAAVNVPPARYEARAIPLPARSTVALQEITGPFRPPIA